MKGWNVRSGRKVDANQAMSAFVDVILGEALADFSRSYADDAIVAQIVSCVPAENMDGQSPLLEKLAASLELRGDYILKETLTAMAATENTAGNDALKLVPDILRARFTR
jgi:hypothetical protein